MTTLDRRDTPAVDDCHDTRGPLAPHVHRADLGAAAIDARAARAPLAPREDRRWDDGPAWGERGSLGSGTFRGMIR